MFGQATYTVDESDDTSTTGVTENTVEVTLTLSADPERTVVIPIETTELDGATGADYSVPSSVTFNAGETSKSFVFTATHDTVDDDGERVRLSFGTPPDRVSAGTQDQTTVSITDDDDPFVTVQFGQTTYTVDESDDTSTTGVEENKVEVTLTLSADPERTVVIPIETTELDGATGADYSVPSSVTFNAGETSKSFVFTATHDTVDDDGERVRLSFGTPPDAGERRREVRDHRQHHRRRRPLRHGAVRAGFPRRGRGGDGQRDHHPEREPRAHGDHPRHVHRQGRRNFH